MMKKRGFTLIEVVVVLTIIGLLATLSVLQYNMSIEESKRVTFQSTILTALSAAESYRQKYGEYPSTATLNLLFNDTAYFTTKPINPYTSLPLQATTDQSLEASSEEGYFYYNVKPDGSLEIITNPTIDVSFAGNGGLENNPLPNYTIIFTVKSTDNSAISGAQIIIAGSTITTDSNGNASIMLPKGSFFYSVTKDGYNFHTDNIELTGDVSVTVTLTPETYTVTVFVMDATTNKAISGATLSGIGSGGVTDQSGKFTFTDVVAQNYTLQASASGYMDASKDIIVNNNQQVNITLSRATCTITFNITNGNGALVQFSDGSTLNLDITGTGSVVKPCGEYSYTISKEGSSSLSGNIDASSDIIIQGIMATIPSSCSCPSGG